MRTQAVTPEELEEVLVGALGLFARDQVPGDLRGQAADFARLHAHSRRPLLYLVGRFLAYLVLAGRLRPHL